MINIYLKRYRDFGDTKITDNVYNSVPAGGATSVYGKTIEMTKGTDTYYLTINAEKELLVGFRNNPNEANIWKKYVSTSDFANVMCAVSTIANIAVKIPDAPTTGSWSAVSIDHSATVNCMESIMWQGDGWYIYSAVAQQVLVKFTRLPTAN